ncbi:MAG: 23S rRNA (uracil(1939)-C(5))-methyltransferase RlmD, partial [Halanaerobiaceae bacterium]
IKPVIGSDYPFAYRNKAQFPLTKNSEGKIVTGFYRKGSHQIETHDSCRIQHPLLNRVMRKILLILNNRKHKFSVYNEETHRGLLRHLVVRAGICTNQALLIMVTSRQSFTGKKRIAAGIMDGVPELVGVLQNVNPEKTNVILGKDNILLQGQDHYFDYIGRLKFKISPLSFFQINTLQTRKLYDVIAEFADLSGNETVVDAYCGTGSISIYLAAQLDTGGKVIGIEEVETAVGDARENAALNNIDNCQFIYGRVEDRLSDLIDTGIVPELFIFDPPRKGLKGRVIDTVLSVSPDRIIYVSCNPATLARDLARFVEFYRLKRVQPVDMFPQTYHIECVVLLEKREKEG